MPCSNKKLAGYFHAAALTIALFIQTNASPLAGAWLFFHFGGIFLLFASNGYRQPKNIIWHAALAWLLIISISAFFLAPIKGAAMPMFTLTAAPLIALALSKDDLAHYRGCFFVVIFLYAAGIIFQYVFDLRQTVNDFNYSGKSWPLLNPNNAAAVLNCALIPCFFLFLRKKIWIFPFVFFSFSLYCTDSMAGMGAAAIACAVILTHRFGIKFIFFAVPSVAAFLLLVWQIAPHKIAEALESFATRFPIWAASEKLLHAQTWLGVPYTGLGLGSFGFYYAHVRTEQETAGWYAHNDLLQITIEAGILGGAAFAFLIFCALYFGLRKNVIAASVLLAIALQSLVEFQFYVVPISLCFGLALAHLVQSVRYDKLGKY